MDATRHLPQTGLEWKQPSAFARSYELRMGDEVVARLSFQKVFSSLALADWGPEQWVFQRHGFLHPRVTIRRPDQEQDLAEYKPHWTGRKGALHGPGEQQRHLCVNNLLATAYSWKDENGDVLLTMSAKGVIHSGGDLTVTDAGARQDDIVMLILLGWYLVQMARQDSVRAGAGAD